MAMSAREVRFIDLYQVNGFKGALDCSRKAGMDVTRQALTSLLRRADIAEEVRQRKKEHSPEEVIYRVKMLRLQRIIEDDSSTPGEVNSAIKTMNQIDGDQKREREERRPEAPKITFSKHTAKPATN